jgi:hypothetical protein
MLRKGLRMHLRDVILAGNCGAAVRGVVDLRVSAYTSALVEKIREGVGRSRQTAERRLTCAARWS